MKSIHNIHVSERKKNGHKRVDKLVVEKFLVVSNFHDAIKSCHDRKSMCLPFFYLLQVFPISRGF